jgi:hypothetical protein
LIRVSLRTIETRGAKIREVLGAMGSDFSKATVVRINTRFVDTLKLGPMAEGQAENVELALASPTSVTPEIRA